MATHGTLGPFDLALGDWKSYVERAELYFTANDVDDNGKMRAILLSSCGDVTYRRIKDVLSPRTPAEVTFRDICTAMSTHLQPQPSEIVQRFRFNTRVRQPQETIATYVTQLKRLAESCNFGDAARLNEMIRDRLVCGIANGKWQQRLLAEEGLTYDKAYKLLLSLEASEKEVKDLTIPDATAVHQLRPFRKTSAPTYTERGEAQPCYRCGGEHSHSSCRFKDAECRYCHKKGHIAAVCRQKLKNSKPSSRQIHTAAGQQEEEEDFPEYSNLIDRITTRTPLGDPLMVTIEIEGIPVKMEVDTGATLSIMSYSTLSSTWPEALTPEIKPTQAKLRTYTGEKIVVKGAIDVKVKYGGQEAEVSHHSGWTRPNTAWKRLVTIFTAGLGHAQPSNTKD
ncbi:uncharacterized protein LOC135351366 [Halichondria panicea]|uniref:uncharacterized protein LOC135351366 n=1 Tax=Halichondria panicea TaxID=6063 RepID=UPI00312B8397